MLQWAGKWVRVSRPLQIITAFSPAELYPALQQVETAVNTHHFTAVGFLSYEAAAAFDLAVHPPLEGLPLLWFALYEQVDEFPTLPWAAQGQTSAPSLPPYQIGPWQPAISPETYATAFAAIKAYIAQGHTYQVNYTFPLQAIFGGDEQAFFADLVAAQQAQYAAYLDIGRFAFCSASPELFLRLDGNQLESRPMKGTAGRGRFGAEDEANRTWLAQSAKNQAENVMIVDMIRNDMGRIAHIGSVQVPALFTVERYPTVLQMTSTVTATTTATLADILAHMFPCASITGAPKIRTMQLIRELEPQPRGVYCGAIGLIRPFRQAQFNVAIRTVLIDRAQGAARYGVGGGIVWDSQLADEYAECQMKAQVLTSRRPSFQLLETMLWEPQNGLFLLPEHLARLTDSAVYFGIPLDTAPLLAALAKLLPDATEPHKVRLLVHQDGTWHIQTTPLTADPAPAIVRVGASRQPVNSQDIWLFHKTTQRQVYTAAKATRPDCDDVILWNEREELTETSTANLVLVLDGDWLTPPQTAGLLAGTLRAQLLRQGLIREQVITLADLGRCQQIYLINSLRGWREAVWVNS